MSGDWQRALQDAQEIYRQYVPHAELRRLLRFVREVTPAAPPAAELPPSLENPLTTDRIDCAPPPPGCFPGGNRRL